MHRRAARRRLTAWIAVLAVLLMSLAPTVSHALGRASVEGWVEVCSAEGSRWVLAEPAGAGGAPGAVAHLLDHCPCCSSHAPTLGLPFAPGSTALGPDLSDEVPQAFLAAARTLFAWVGARSRAPPLLS